MFQSMFKHLNLVHQGQVVIVRSHTLHDSMFNVEQDLLFLAVVLDETVEGVRVWDPADQAGVGGQGDDGETLNGQVASEGFGITDQE